MTHAVKTRPVDTPSPDEGERLYLRENDTKGQFDQRYVKIRSPAALACFTRLALLTLTLVNGGLIVTSVWLMLACRHHFSNVRVVVPQDAYFCTNLGMPALFACCILLFAVFGLGCTGRRLTGYALIVISSVEILQGVTTLSFYQCNTTSRPEVLTTVNATLATCLPTSAQDIATSMAMGSRQETKTVRQQREANDLDSKYDPLLDSPLKYHRDIATLTGHKQRHQRHRRLHREIRALGTPAQNRKTKTLANPAALRKPARGRNPSKPKKPSGPVLKVDVHPFSEDISCEMEHDYFVNLSVHLKPDEVERCVDVCKAYREMCGVEHITEVMARQDSALFGYTNFDGIAMTSAPPLTVSQCGESIYRQVKSLCYYDNQVILPLSMCAPFINILISVFFIYLAFCDRRVKESDGESGVFTPLASSNDQKRFSWNLNLSLYSLWKDTNSVTRPRRSSQGACSCTTSEGVCTSCQPWRGISKPSISQYSLSSEKYPLRTISSTPISVKTMDTVLPSEPSVHSDVSK